MPPPPLLASSTVLSKPRSAFNARRHAAMSNNMTSCINAKSLIKARCVNPHTE